MAIKIREIREIRCRKKHIDPLLKDKGSSPVIATKELQIIFNF